MLPTRYPKKQGLYDPRQEHDACGMGFIAHVNGKKSHAIVTDALEALNRLTHRGGCGCEANSGDGAGVLLQLPHEFFSKVCPKAGIDLPDSHDYAVGMVFLPSDKADQEALIALYNDAIEREGQRLLGWRDVPTDNSNLGKTAKSAEPVIKQVFVDRSPYLKDELTFERKLYVIRRRAEHAVAKSSIAGKGDFYVASFSARTIVFKGMLLSEQVSTYYTDLQDEDLTSAIATVHSRFSTNTFPSWMRAHPNRMTVHNGEINTLRGNVNMMRAKESLFSSEYFGDDMKKLMPVVDEDGSDSSMMDNCLEFLTLTGYSIPHALMMMIPEPWVLHKQMPDERRAFYDFHSCMMEPWDGPASIGVTDGTVVCAVLDRNGLRPSRYIVTKDDHVIMASEVGVVDVPEENIKLKGRLEPGRMFMVDTKAGRIINDEELKHEIVTQKPYRKWLNENLIQMEDIPFTPVKTEAPNAAELMRKQMAFGYTREDLNIFLKPMARTGLDPLGAMGDDAPLSVLSNQSTLLYSYFKQLFAQVTNPPLDASFETLVTSTITTIGGKENILEPGPQNCRQIRMATPILTNEDLEKLKQNHLADFPSVIVPMLFDRDKKHDGLEAALEAMFAKADEAIENGARIIILSDREFTPQLAPIPALLAAAGMHHHLIRKGTRSHIGLIVESGEPREVHHFCCLLGYGVSAINPYLSFESLDSLIETKTLQGLTKEKATANYLKAVNKGIVKVMSKMGISAVQSYRGAQIFEALGLKTDFVDKYFSGTPTRIEGIGLDKVTEEALRRHRHAYPVRDVQYDTLGSGGKYQWRKDGEEHLFNPESIHALQKACRNNDQKAWDQWANLINDQAKRLFTIRGLMEFTEGKSIPIEEVESAADIMKRFKTGAMSYGSISIEAHETLAIAMNRIGGRSNTGEGGENPDRFIPMENGDSKNSAIKQIASGRFGVTSNYLVNAKELQIKMAQGAKPGEGGQLPGSKVYPWVAKTRHSTPGVGLISPPPHHDIYSIEDIAELIHDLKNANDKARINVKLVSKVGVGTIAAGVTKGHADVVLISGYDGGTGASPQTSIKNTGLPWELGLSEAHQTLMLNNLRSRVVVETDGQLKTGRDVAIAALLGAEEFGFATAPLVVTGCIMMRVCHKNTCPVGIATQDPNLRAKYTGSPDHVVNFFQFIAEELRGIMAELGFRSINEMIGRVDRLESRDASNHWKAQGIDLGPILHKPDVPADWGTYCTEKQDHGLDISLDQRTLLNLCKPAIEKGEKVEASIAIKNTNRVVGTQVGSAITRAHGADGLPDDTIFLTFTGSAGQSLGAFIPKGLTLKVLGDTNDYLGKGLSGGRIIVTPAPSATFAAEENIITGNTCFYGATGGQAFISGIAGERFCVRNSGAEAVVEGLGDHGCEYMTGGRVICLGETGRNFAAGMSGGIAYVFDTNCQLSRRCNKDMVQLETLQDEEETAYVRSMIEKHVRYTNSQQGQRILDNWENDRHRFTKVMPVDYKRIMGYMQEARDNGVKEEDVPLTAFEMSVR